MIKAVLFDLDGTLTDRFRSKYGFYREYLIRLFPDLDPESMEYEAIIQDELNFDMYGIGPYQYNQRFFAEKYQVDREQLADLLSREYEIVARHIVLKPEAIEVLKYLKDRGYKLAILSNGHSLTQWTKINALDEKAGLKSFFDSIIVSGDLPFNKPDRRIFDLSAERLGVRNEECLMVGDNFRNDILGAYEAGMECAYIWKDPEIKVSEEIRWLHSLKDLEAFL